MKNKQNTEKMKKENGKRSVRSKRSQEEREEAKCLYGEDVYNVDELMTIFQCCRETVLRKLRSGALTGFKPNGLWLVRERELEAYIQSQLQSGRHLRRLQEPHDDEAA
jgi:Helix-turn-helix domain